MNDFRFPIRLIGAAALFCAVSAAHATMTFATVATGGNSSTAAQTYQASVGGAWDNFGDLTINDPTPLGTAGVLNRTAVYPGPLSYTVSTQTNLYSVQSPVIGGPALSVENTADSLTFSNFGGVNPVVGIRNFGASFYLSELTASNAVAATNMSVKATDVNGLIQNFSFSQGSSGGAATLFFTMASTVALQSVEFIAPLGTSFYATIDNVVLAPVPLPAAAWLLLTGLGSLGLFKRRRG